MAKQKAELGGLEIAMNLRTVTLTVEGVSQLSWSKMIEKCPPKKDQTEWEETHWRDRLFSQDGQVMIPTMAMRLAIQEAAKGIGIPGEGKATYAQPIRSTVTPEVEFVPIGVKLDDVEHEWRLVPANPSNNKPGVGARVNKCFPLIRKWGATISFSIFDDRITPHVFEQLAKRAGLAVGIGRFRPSNGGFYGRFKIKSIVWS